VFYNKPTIGNSQEKKPGTTGNPGFWGNIREGFILLHIILIIIK
jgi:hypothetical protein